MEPQARGKAGGKKGGKRAYGDLDTYTAGAGRAPVVSVPAPANLERVPTTSPPSDPLTGSQIVMAGVYFFLWSTLNIGYNITNKKALNAIALPWTTSVLQLVVGSMFVLPLWVLELRDAPGLTMDNVKALCTIAACHMLSHVCAVIGLGAGAVSLVHIVKAAEPLLTALLSAIFLKQIFSPVVYATLIPVVAGVALASLKELDFKWAALGGALGANLAASTRAILSKRSMGMGVGKNMSPANLYAVVNIMAAAMLLLLAAFVEGPKIEDIWTATVTSPEKSNEIVFNTVASGIFFYLYNEVAFRCLGIVHPVTHAVGNTFKRVFLIATSIIIFRANLTPLAAMGSVMAIAGVLLYGLVKKWDHRDLDTDTAGAVRDTAVSVSAPADPEQVPTTAPPSEPLTGSQIGARVFLWFVLYVASTYFNEVLEDSFNLAISISAAQLIIGSIIATSLWVFRLRPAPRLTAKDARAIAPMAVWHALSHFCTAISLAAGWGVPSFIFGGTIIATEPLFAGLVSTIFLKQAFHPMVYVTTLVLAAGGVVLVLANSDDTYLPVDSPEAAVCFALGFNLAASMCTILSKRSMGMDIGKNMSPANLYAVVHIMASAMFLLLAIIMEEGSGIVEMLGKIIDTLAFGDPTGLVVVPSGVSFYFYNEVAFRCLGRVRPSTYTMGSALKFTFFMIFSMIVLRDGLIYLAAAGLLTVIAGVLLYTLATTTDFESLSRQWRQGKQENLNL